MHDLQVILITEHMSSGSLKKFLRKTKKNNRKIPLQSWRRWCTQVFSAENFVAVMEALFSGINRKIPRTAVLTALHDIRFSGV
jgi:hypothetical protein